jgi:hypothetical protein
LTKHHRRGEDDAKADRTLHRCPFAGGGTGLHLVAGARERAGNSGHGKRGTGCGGPNRRGFFGNLAGLIACDSSAVLSISTATSTQAIALAAGKSIYICGFVVNAGGTTTARLVQGTGTNCGTGQANLTPAFNLAVGGSVALGTGLGQIFRTSSGGALCVTNSAAIALNILVIYTQF